MEEVFLRFGHLGKQIFNNLDYQSLKDCRDVSQSWEDFVHHEKILSFQTIKFYSKVTDSSIRKRLRKSDSDQAAKLAKDVKFVYYEEKVWLGVLEKHYRSYPFHFAAENDHLEIYEMITENMEDKNPKNHWGVTPLHQAAEMGHLEICKLIVNNVQCDKEMCMRYQCRKNPKDDCYFTPLHKAAMNGHFQVCKLIIENVCENPKPRSDRGDSKNPKSRYGSTPLHNAALSGHLQVCQLIIENVQQKNPKDRYMFTPFDYAIKKEHTLVANFLEKYARRTKKRKITDLDKWNR